LDWTVYVLATLPTKTRKVVGTMKSEFGIKAYSEKLLFMMFTDGHLQRVQPVREPVW
jgi:hypothetical protein